MILPSKHISLAESLFGFGGYILGQLREPKTIDQLWESHLKVNNTKKFPAYHSFDDMVLAIDFLFMIGAVNINDQGQLFYETNQTGS